MRRRINILFVLVIALSNSCLESYDPPSAKNNPDFMVVEGFINANGGTAEVRISHTQPLDAIDKPKHEEGAIVTLEDENGNTFMLSFSDNGKYIGTALPIDTSKKYRLNIKTNSNREYQSDFINMKISPPIDSITYLIDEQNNLNINVNTHDNSGGTRYYRWDYVETFEYQTNYSSGYIVQQGVVRQRLEEEQIHTCWRTNYSGNILLGSTQRLNDDVVKNFTIAKIQPGDIRITRKYSILVHQFALTQNAFEYWQNIQRTTESLGGLFDPMPSQVLGNFHCLTDPDEKVIGYFGGGYITEKRIFISKSDLPKDYSKFSQQCFIDTIDVAQLQAIRDPDALIAPVYPPGFPVIIGYTTSSKPCIDCRALANGVTTKPDFWE